MIIKQKITILKIRKPSKENINEELQWLGTSLGLFGLRDKDKSSFRLFIELIKQAKRDQGVSSDELAYRVGLSRGTIVHHLRKLIDAGLVVKDKNRYILRVDSLEKLVDELEADMKDACEDLRDIAKDIDSKLK